jgi:hypothetical protein
MVKIFSDDGTKGVQVGTRIAVIGDEGDSIDSLEIPADDSQPAKSPSENVAKAETSAPSYSTGTESAPKGTPGSPRPKSSPPNAGTGSVQNPKYPMYPSVIALIHENHISDADVAKIPATGPSNRLLKGDVLAYLGTIDADYSKQQSERIEHASHMDLRNIKILAPEKKAEKPTTLKDAAPELPVETLIQLPISLSEVLKLQKRIQDTLQISLPLSTFLARAVDFANEDLPVSKSKPTADDLFDAVLGLDQIPRAAVKVSRGQYLPSITPAPAGAPLRAQPIRKPREVDIIDALTGRAGPLNQNPTARAVGKMIAAGGTAGAVNVFTLIVPAGEAKRARIFLERMKTVLQVEPGKLVL